MKNIDMKTVSHKDWRVGIITYVDQRIIRFKATASDMTDRIIDYSLRSVKSLNQYMFAYLSVSNKVIFKVVSIEENERFYGQEAEDKSHDQYIFTAIPLGQISAYTYHSGIVELPMVGSSIYVCSPKDLQQIFDDVANYKTAIGNLNSYPDIRPKLDISKFFTGHTVIVGNTGSGKSTTARLLLHKIFELFNNISHPIKDNTKIVVFDVHGDYQELIDKNKSKKNEFTKIIPPDEKSTEPHLHIIAPEQYHLCAGALGIEDWASILAPSERIQKPLLERAIKYSKLHKEERNKLFAAFAYTALSDTSLDSHAARKMQIGKYYQKIRLSLTLNPDSPVADNYFQASRNNKAKKLGDIVCDAYNGINKESRLPHHFYQDDLEDDGGKISTKVTDFLFRCYTLNFGNMPDSLPEALQAIFANFLSDEYMTNNGPNYTKICSNPKKDDDVTLVDIKNALDFVFDEEEVSGNHQARAYSEGLVTRFKNLCSKYSDSLFNTNNGEEVAEYLRQSKGISVLEISPDIDSDGLKLFSNFIARKLFSDQRDHYVQPIDRAPTVLVFDEAHRYIREADLQDDSIFNQIAREGRKFGVFLTVISQIPSELSKVVLSQASTFIIQRVQNSMDLQYLRENVPSITNDEINRLPSFAPGMAVIFGNSMKIPVELQIDGDYKDATPNISIYNNVK